MITIKQPYSFSEIGKKDNQEDYIFPQQAQVNTRVFILCDGMGGHERGEVASETVANTLGGFLTNERVNGIDVDRSVFNSGLDRAYNALDRIDKGEAKKPGTTMTALCINDNSCLLAHIGDSRIYQIRPSEFNSEKGQYGIKYMTQDHSLVNDLLRAGELTPEEAKNFPQKNVITRAMQPNLERRYRADIVEITDIKEGDYFFMCCDGVLEQLTSERLASILAEQMSDQDKIEAIRKLCEGRTRDNFTCWLIPIDKAVIKVQQPPKFYNGAQPPEVIGVTPVADSGWGGGYNQSPYGAYPGNQIRKEEKKSWTNVLFTVLIVLVAFVAGMFIYSNYFNPKTTEYEKATGKEQSTKKSKAGTIQPPSSESSSNSNGDVEGGWNSTKKVEDAGTDFYNHKQETPSRNKTHNSFREENIPMNQRPNIYDSKGNKQPTASQNTKKSDVTTKKNDNKSQDNSPSNNQTKQDKQKTVGTASTGSTESNGNNGNIGNTGNTGNTGNVDRKPNKP